MSNAKDVDEYNASLCRAAGCKDPSKKCFPECSAPFKLQIYDLCIDCERPSLVKCDCRPDCPGARCAGACGSNGDVAPTTYEPLVRGPRSSNAIDSDLDMARMLDERLARGRELLTNDAKESNAQLFADVIAQAKDIPELTLGAPDIRVIPSRPEYASPWSRPEHIKMPPSPWSESYILYVFEHREKQEAVWLHKISAHEEFLRGPGYLWRCSCGVGEASNGRPLTSMLLWEAWSHFDDHIDPSAVPMNDGLQRWNRGATNPDLRGVFDLEVKRILGTEPELPIEVVHRCGFCGETFEISKDDPHWSLGRGPLCPNRAPAHAPVLAAEDFAPTEYDQVIEIFARCNRHNTIRKHAKEPCWKCHGDAATRKSTDNSEPNGSSKPL